MGSKPIRPQRLKLWARLLQLEYVPGVVAGQVGCCHGRHLNLLILSTGLKETQADRQ